MAKGHCPLCDYHQLREHCLRHGETKQLRCYWLKCPRCKTVLDPVTKRGFRGHDQQAFTY